MGKSDTRIDNVVMIFSGFAVLIAATLTMATISNHSGDLTAGNELALSTPDPLKRAELAAKAGIDAARYHIECHGRTSAGRIAPRFYVNGATFAAEWDDVDMADSTTVIRSTGDFSWGGEKSYQADMESKIKLSFLPTHKQEILERYYSRDDIVITDSEK